MKQSLPIEVKGHLHIADDLGQVLVDKKNAVHPQNLARVIARALSNEHNYTVYRMAFGNGGTEVDAAYTITYKTPNDGQSPDTATWQSRLYNETYSEIIDESSVLLGTDPGSSDSSVGSRPGGGANPADDPVSVEHVSGPGVRSNELGLTSEVIITVVLNPGEPSGQLATDSGATDTESDFSFDEIGLFTPGSGAIDSSGYQDVDVGDSTTSGDTGLTTSTQYSFTITVDGGSAQIIDITTPDTGSGGSGEILYGDLCEALNTGTWAVGTGGVVSAALSGATVTITDDTGGSFSSVPSGTQTYGFLKFQSSSTGSTSTIVLADGGGTGTLFASLIPAGTIETAVDGSDAGIQNDPVNYSTERERLLTHVIFSPVLKSANRTLTVTYTLTVSVARSV